MPHPYYADGYRKVQEGVPCKVFSKRLSSGRYIRNPKWTQHSMAST